MRLSNTTITVIVAGVGAAIASLYSHFRQYRSFYDDGTRFAWTRVLTNFQAVAEATLLAASVTVLLALTVDWLFLPVRNFRVLVSQWIRPPSESGAEQREEAVVGVRERQQRRLDEEAKAAAVERARVQAQQREEARQAAVAALEASRGRSLRSPGPGVKVQRSNELSKEGRRKGGGEGGGRAEADEAPLGDPAEGRGGGSSSGYEVAGLVRRRRGGGGGQEGGGEDEDGEEGEERVGGERGEGGEMRGGVMGGRVGVEGGGWRSGASLETEKERKRQDAAFAASLRRDRAIEERRREEEEKRRIEAEEQEQIKEAERRAEEQRRKEEEESKRAEEERKQMEEERREHYRRLLPPEPGADVASEERAVVAVRLPCGTVCRREWRRADTVGDIYNWVRACVCVWDMCERVRRGRWWLCGCHVERLQHGGRHLQLAPHAPPRGPPPLPPLLRLSSHHLPSPPATPRLLRLRLPGAGRPVPASSAGGGRGG
ncbi:unnamed protein product [Closterium sp. NIES-53]